eukprot:1158163-Pelagomonas_calceolata.AAC.6
MQSIQDRQQCSGQTPWKLGQLEATNIEVAALMHRCKHCSSKVQFQVDTLASGNGDIDASRAIAT